jgi:hypothetical protein
MDKFKTIKQIIGEYKLEQLAKHDALMDARHEDNSEMAVEQRVAECRRCNIKVKAANEIMERISKQ